MGFIAFGELDDAVRQQLTIILKLRLAFPVMLAWRHDLIEGIEAMLRARAFRDSHRRKPVDAIKAHLNPYLLDQDYLRKMTALERGRS